MKYISEIQKNIPIPKGNKKRGQLYNQYPFDIMDIGDSFYITGAKSRSTVFYHAKKFNEDRVKNNIKPFKFIFRPVTEKYKYGVRCWRTE